MLMLRKRELSPCLPTSIRVLLKESPRPCGFVLFFLIFTDSNAGKLVGAGVGGKGLDYGDGGVK